MYIIVGIIGNVTNKYLNKENFIFFDDKEEASIFKNRDDAKIFLEENKEVIRQGLKKRYRSSKCVGDKIIESKIPSIVLNIIEY